MAHLIAPPSAVQPMTKEDVAVVQAEKRVDAATREQLVKVYGDSRDPHGRPIDLTRPVHRNWKCAACGKTSTDLRHVCGFCLAPEPGFTNTRLQGRGLPSAGRASTQAGARDGNSVQRPGTSNDAAVRMLHVEATKRCYRVITEPHVPTVHSHAKALQRVAQARAAADGGEDEEEEEWGEAEDGENAAWDDEPDCRPHATPPQGSAAKPEAERRAPKEEVVDGGFTHFVSIPLGKLPAITANATRVLEDLRSFVAASAGGDGDSEGEAERGDEGRAAAAAAAAAVLASSKSTATPDLVTSTAKLHMTLLMLTLPTRDDVEFAKELLQGPFASAWAAVKEKAVVAAKHAGSSSSSSGAPSLMLSGDTSIAPAHRHPFLHLGGGLQVMKAGSDNELYQPEKASVVYLGIDDPAALATVQQLQRVLHDSFAELIRDPAEAERSRRVLHVTVMNKKWRKARGARRPFDARPILEVFQDACIGAGDEGDQPFEIPELELCSMRRHDSETGTYYAEATVKV